MTTRRRHVPSGSGASELSSPQASRSDSYPYCNQHHHHYHYHHHIHHFPREQGQRTVSSRNTGSMDLQRVSFSNMLAFESEFHGLNVPGTSALLRLRRNQGDDTRSYGGALGLHFDDEVDELLEEFSIGEWLAASGIDENWDYVGSESFDPGSSSLGLSKETIKGLPREVFRPNGSGPSEQNECPVCLDNFILGQHLICLPCNHKFHCQCLTPWLTCHSQCPCCRAKINAKKKSDDILALMEAVDSGISIR